MPLGWCEVLHGRGSCDDGSWEPQVGDLVEEQSK